MINQSNIRSLLNSKFAQDSSWLLFSYGILAVLGILINVIVVKFFGTTGFGTFSLALKIYLIASLIGTLGNGVSIVKFAAEFDEHKTDFKFCLSSALTISFTAGICIAFASYSLSGFFGSLFNIVNFSEFFELISMAIPFFCLNKTFMGALNGLRSIKTMSIFLSARWIILTSIIYYFSINGAFLNMALSFLISEGILFLFFIIYFRNEISFFEKNLIFWIKKHLKFGLKSITSNVIMDIYYYLDVFMVGIFANAQSVGIYSFASDISKNLLIPANILQTSFNPIASKMVVENKIKELKSSARKIRNYTFLIYLPMVIILTSIYPLAISFMKDESMAQSFVLFFVLNLGILIVSGYKPLFSITEMAGFPEDRLLINVMTLLVNVILNFVLFQYWNMIGVAIATVISYIFSIIALNLSTKKRLSFNILW